MPIGAVAGDITGATDLCLMLSHAGLRTLQIMGVPERGQAFPEADAIVIAPKSRSIPAAEAVILTVAAGKALKDAGTLDILFKYCSTQRAAGKRILVVDTLEDGDLRILGAACSDMPLVTGGSGIALGLAANFATNAKAVQTTMQAPEERAIVPTGSGSQAVRVQIAAAEAAGMPLQAVNVEALAEGRHTVSDLVEWAIAQPADTIPVIYSCAEPLALQAIQTRLGQHVSGALVESTFADAARALKDADFCRFIIAGGETSGAVLAALGATEELEETAKLFLLLQNRSLRTLTPAQVADLLTSFNLPEPETHHDH